MEMKRENFLIDPALTRGASSVIKNVSYIGAVFIRITSD